VQQKQGHAPFGVEMKIADDGGNRLPWDGKTFGQAEGTWSGGGQALIQGKHRSA
jgi:hypothetical protein